MSGETISFIYDQNTSPPNERIPTPICNYWQKKSQYKFVVLLCIDLNLFFPCRMMERRERNPELWVRCRYEDLYMKAVTSVAEFVGSKPENLVLLENASSGKMGW